MSRARRVELPPWRWWLVASVVAVAAGAGATWALREMFPGSRWADILGLAIGPVIGAVIGTAHGQQVAARRNTHPYEKEVP